MNNDFKNEILMDGYIFDKDLTKKCFKIKNNEDIIEFRYKNDFDESKINELNGDDLIRIKGSFDQDEYGLFYLASDILVLPQFKKGEM